MGSDNLANRLRQIKIIATYYALTGDFHFLWETQRVILESYWGTPRAVGSLSNLRLSINRLSVDQKGKVFSVGDEFIIHCFHSHLISNICDQFHLDAVDSKFPHQPTEDWLKSTATTIVSHTILPVKCSDPSYSFHRSFMHTAFLYADLREAIRFENGPHIVQLWKHWLLYFLATGKRNYTTEAANLLCNLKAVFPAHIAYIVTHNRTVNTSGKEGRGKPIDQMIEHYNL